MYSFPSYKGIFSAICTLAYNGRTWRWESGVYVCLFLCDFCVADLGEEGSGKMVVDKR